MSRPWTPEVVVDPALARRLIRARFPEVPAERVEAMGAGWDNTAYLVDGTWVFRFAHRAVAVPLLRTEFAVLGALAGRLPLAVPQPAFVADDGPGHPWPFLGYPRLPGRTACVADLAPGPRAATAPVLGRFLAALHDTPTDGLDLASAGEQRRRPLEDRRPMIVERLDALVRRGWIGDAAPWIARFDAERPRGRVAPEDALVHGDVYARHLLVDDDDRLSGVIDWGDVHRGDRALDLLFAYTFLPAAARTAFFEAYGPVDDDTLAEARRWGILHAATLAWYGGELGDGDLAREGRLGLAHVLED